MGRIGGEGVEKSSACSEAGSEGKVHPPSWAEERAVCGAAAPSPGRVGGRRRRVPVG
jgi:hypothetical protein